MGQEAMSQSDGFTKIEEDISEPNTSKDSESFGRCDWTDIEGNSRCNSPWSMFQCQQAGGVFTPGGSCDDGE